MKPLDYRWQKAGPLWVPQAMPNPIFLAGLLKPAAGGGGGGSCPADGSPTFDQTTQDNAQNTGNNDDYFYVGDRFTPASSVDLCKARYYVSKVGAGSIAAKYLTCRIYTVVSNNLSSLVATSDSVAGSDAWSATALYWQFGSPTNLSSGTEYGRVIYFSDSGGTPIPSSGTAYINIQFKETGGTDSNFFFYSWNTAFGLNYAFGSNSKGKGSLYYRA